MFENLRHAIVGRRVLRFDYYGQYGEMTEREVEPVQLLFKEYTWYLRAFCRTRKAMRLFKVLRMKRLQILDEMFVADRKRLQEQEPEVLCKKPEDFEITIRIDKKEAYRVYDRFDEEEITVLPDGNFLIRMRSVPDDWVYGMILSFGPSAKVLAPVEIKGEVRQRIREMNRLYSGLVLLLSCMSVLHAGERKMTHNVSYYP